MTFGEINTALLSDPLTEEELRRLMTTVGSRLRFERERDGMKIASTLKLHQKVGFGDKASFGTKRSYKEGRIVHLNKKSATVLVNSQEWTVPYSMIALIDKKADGKTG